MIALGKRPGLICKGAQPVDVYVGGHPVTPGITLEDYPLQEASGNVVTCEPLTGYKLGVTSHITAVQEGTGDPSPDNVRPIVGWDSVTLTHNDQTHTRALPETVYGGTLDWRTGLLTVTHERIQFDGTELWRSSQGAANQPKFFYYLYKSINNTGNSDNVICSHLRSDWQDVWQGIDYTIGLYGQQFRVRYNQADGDAEAWKAYLVAQHEAGTPVEVAYPVTPYTIQLTPQQLVALAGTNTIYSNSGDTKVTYRIRKT